MNSEDLNQKKSIFIVSDSTGETAMAMVKAAVIQFKDSKINITRFKNIRNETQVSSTLQKGLESRAMIIHTMVSPTLRNQIHDFCQLNQLPEIDLLGPVLQSLSRHLDNQESQSQAGLLRQVDEGYFKRIAAIEYTVKHDDGKLLSDLDQADIILVGISRTSKTPLSIFMSHHGWKVANIPLVKGTPLPEQLKDVDQRKIVGLTIDPDSLMRIRRNRLEKFGQDPGGEYATPAHIQDELEYSLELFRKNRKWPVFNVTDKALEETATEILKVISKRLGLKTLYF